jgi:hypothetical protein
VLLRRRNGDGKGLKTISQALSPRQPTSLVMINAVVAVQERHLVADDVKGGDP